MEPTVHYGVYKILLLVAVLANWIQSMPFLLFLITLNLYSTCILRDKVSQPHKTTFKIIAMYILIIIFLDNRWEDKMSDQMVETRVTC